VGKTTLVRHFIRRIPYDKNTIGYISNTHKSKGSMLDWVLLAMKLDDGREELGNMQRFSRIQPSTGIDLGVALAG